MKKFLLLFFICSVYLSVAQEQKAGAYLSYQDFVNNTPAYSDSLIIYNKRSDYDIQRSGGNDYIVGSKNKELNKILENKIWGIYMRNDLFLNSKLLTGVNGYAKVEVLGKYNVINPSFPIQHKKQKDIDIDMVKGQPATQTRDNSELIVGNMVGIFMGLMTGTFVFFIPTSSTGYSYVKQFPIIYDMETKEMTILNKENLETLVGNFHNLKMQFSLEKNKEDKETLLKYVKILNELEK